MRGVMVRQKLASFMEVDQEGGAVLVDFLGLKAHSNLLTSIYQVGAPSFRKVYATYDAIGWDEIPEAKQEIIESGKSLWKIALSFFRLAKLVVVRDRKIFVAGATTLACVYSDIWVS